MLTSYADDEALFSAIMAGAAGYVLKQVSSTELVEGVRRVGRGEQRFLAKKTVTNYVSNLLAKLGMSRRSEAAAYGAPGCSERRQHHEPHS